MIYKGSCHCGAISFDLEAPESVTCSECNCSICSKAGYLHYIVPRTKLTGLQGRDSLTTYTWGTGVARHTFCKTCGIKPFYVPRSNPDGYDVNVRCLEPQPPHLEIVPFDGRNWDKHAHELAHLSKD